MYPFKGTPPDWEAGKFNKNLGKDLLERSILFSYICIYNSCIYMNVEAIIKARKEIPLESRTIIHLMLIHNVISESAAAALKPFEVSAEQFNVLRILQGQDGKPANLSTLNERMITRMSNTGRLVDKLLAKGYVTRSVCPANRRKVEILITPEGTEALKKMSASMKEAENQLLSRFSKEDLQRLNDLLNLF